MYNNPFLKLFLLIVSILLFVSCDKDFNQIGDALIGDNHFDLSKEYYDVVAYNQKIGPVQSNSLPINPLGIYINPAFGTTTANFATQLSLTSLISSIDPALKPEIESVYLDIPYFIDPLQTKPKDGGGFTYELDSIYGNKTAKINLSIYESKRYMDKQNAVDQLFYTNQNSEFDNNKGNILLNDDPSSAQNTAFFFDNSQRTVTLKNADVETKTYLPPAMHLKLNNAFFKDKIINAPTGSLNNTQVFNDYFRGLYFKVKQSGADPGCLAMINFAKGTITIKYKENTSITVTDRIDKTITLNLSGNTVSLPVESNPNSIYQTAISNPNNVVGDDKLYLKGGEGSLAIIELFGPDNDKNGIADQLETIRKSGWLINEANLVFYIDEAMKDSFDPERIYLYDFTNSTPVLDYVFDSSILLNSKKSKAVFDGNLNRASAEPKKGLTYKIRITNHIRNLMNQADAKNVKLGLVVTEDISVSTFNVLKTSIVTVIPPFSFSAVPKASVMNPLGTILHGGTSNAPVGKKLRLEIYYTKPN